MNRFLLTLSLLASLTGCATLSHQDPKTGLEITYTGSAHGAARLVHATDPRSFDLAEQAMDKGMATSLTRKKNGDVRFSAGYGNVGYYPTGSVGGYAPANTGYIPGQGFVTGPPQSMLPPLATTVVTTGVPTQSIGGAIVPCPTDRERQTVAEQAACAEEAVDALYRHRTK